jgi:hypothetical protein
MHLHCIEFAALMKGDVGSVNLLLYEAAKQSITERQTTAVLAVSGDKVAKYHIAPPIGRC